MDAGPAEALKKLRDRVVAEGADDVDDGEFIGFGPPDDLTAVNVNEDHHQVDRARGMPQDRGRRSKLHWLPIALHHDPQGSNV